MLDIPAEIKVGVTADVRADILADVTAMRVPVRAI